MTTGSLIITDSHGDHICSEWRSTESVPGKSSLCISVTKTSYVCHNHSYQYPKLPIIGLTYYESYQTGTFHNIVQQTDQLGNVPQCGATRSLPRQLWHGSPCPGCSGRGHPEPSFKAFLNHCAITLCPASPGMGHPIHSFPEW